jgi:hypothetical protein
VGSERSAPYADAERLLKRRMGEVYPSGLRGWPSNAAACKSYLMIWWKKSIRNAKYPECSLAFHHDGQPIVEFCNAWASSVSVPVGASVVT